MIKKVNMSEFAGMDASGNFVRIMYECDSLDEKPVAGVAVGSYLKEIDTGSIYKFNQSLEWNEVAVNPSEGSVEITENTDYMDIHDKSTAIVNVDTTTTFPVQFVESTVVIDNTVPDHLIEAHFAFDGREVLEIEAAPGQTLRELLNGHKVEVTIDGSTESYDISMLDDGAILVDMITYLSPSLIENSWQVYASWWECPYNESQYQFDLNLLPLE